MVVRALDIKVVWKSCNETTLVKSFRLPVYAYVFFLVLIILFCAICNNFDGNLMIEFAALSSDTFIAAHNYIYHHYHGEVFSSRQILFAIKLSARDSSPSMM